MGLSLRTKIDRAKDDSACGYCNQSELTILMNKFFGKKYSRISVSLDGGYPNSTSHLRSPSTTDKKLSSPWITDSISGTGYL